jgi:hypothetical protein
MNLRVFVLALLGAAPALWSQTPAAAAPSFGELKQMYESVKKNVTGAVAKMPDEEFSYKPTPEVRSFAEVVGHLTGSQLSACAAVAGDPGSENAAAHTSKAEVVSALEHSFAVCDRAFGLLNETTAKETVMSRRGQRSKLGMLIGALAHDSEQYGILTVYLRLKGLVPPASEK